MLCPFRVYQLLLNENLGMPNLEWESVGRQSKLREKGICPCIISSMHSSLILYRIIGKICHMLLHDFAILWESVLLIFYLKIYKIVFPLLLIFSCGLLLLLGNKISCICLVALNRKQRAYFVILFELWWNRFVYDKRLVVNVLFCLTESFSLNGIQRI